MLRRCSCSIVPGSHRQRPLQGLAQAPQKPKRARSPRDGLRTSLIPSRNAFSSQLAELTSCELSAKLGLWCDVVFFVHRNSSDLGDLSPPTALGQLPANSDHEPSVA